jgi:hypothetical protein
VDRRERGADQLFIRERPIDPRGVEEGYPRDRPRRGKDDAELSPEEIRPEVAIIKNRPLFSSLSEV